eukprot:4573150-Prymnesium_polylepis.1
MELPSGIAKADHPSTRLILGLHPLLARCVRRRETPNNSLIEASGEPKIGEGIVPICPQQDVLWFHVSMDHAHAVQDFERQRHLRSCPANLLDAQPECAALVDLDLQTCSVPPGYSGRASTIKGPCWKASDRACTGRARQRERLRSAVRVLTRKAAQKGCASDAFGNGAVHLHVMQLDFVPPHVDNFECIKCHRVFFPGSVHRCIAAFAKPSTLRGAYILRAHA